MNIQSFCIEIIKHNFPKLNGQKVHICDLDFKLTNFVTDDDLKKYDIESIIKCVDEIVSETTFVQDNWDNCVLINDDIIKQIISEIEENYS